MNFPLSWKVSPHRKENNNVGNKTRDKKRKGRGKKESMKKDWWPPKGKMTLKYNFIILYLAVDAALCVILSCVREATYDMPFPSAPRSKTCGNSVTININLSQSNKFWSFLQCTKINSHLTMRSAKCMYYRSKFLKFFW